MAIFFGGGEEKFSSLVGRKSGPELVTEGRKIKKTGFLSFEVVECVEELSSSCEGRKKRRKSVC